MEWLVMLRGPTSDFGPSLNLSLGNSLAIRGNPLVSSSSLHANAEASEPVYGHHGEVISAASRSAGLVVHRGARWSTGARGAYCFTSRSTVTSGQRTTV